MTTAEKGEHHDWTLIAHHKTAKPLPLGGGGADMEASWPRILGC